MNNRQRKQELLDFLGTHEILDFFVVRLHKKRELPDTLFSGQKDTAVPSRNPFPKGTRARYKGLKPPVWLDSGLYYNGLHWYAVKTMQASSNSGGKKRHVWDSYSLDLAPDQSINFCQTIAALAWTYDGKIPQSLVKKGKKHYDSNAKRLAAWWLNRLEDVGKDPFYNKWMAETLRLLRQTNNFSFKMKEMEDTLRMINTDASFRHFFIYDVGPPRVMRGGAEGEEDDHIDEENADIISARDTVDSLWT